MSPMTDERDDDPIEATCTRLDLGVPGNVRPFRQWLLWRYEDAPGAGEKARKVPYYASGGRRRGIQGSLEDRSRMVTFPEALAAYRAGKGFYAGVGIAHFGDSPINTIDFDRCIGADKQVHPGLRALIDASGTYAEVSPGGGGVHMIGFGDIRSRKNIHPEGYNVEAFGDSGFVTVTGRAIASDTVCEWKPDIRATLLAWLENDSNEQQHKRDSQMEYARGTDAVYIRLTQLGHIKRAFDDGKISIRCPFESEHTSGGAWTDTVYFLPHTHGYAAGHFKCMHAHCAQRTDADFLQAIGFVGGIPGVDANRGGDRLFVPATDFMEAWRPFQYIIKSVVQRGHLYGFTGHGNAGKTSIALYMAACIACGVAFAGRRVERGRVAYFAGENADDIRVRVIALAQVLRLDADALRENLYIAPHTFPLAKNAAPVAEHLKTIGPLALMVIDTRAAYGSADDENDNVQALYDAMALRQLMEAAGRPATLVLNHPPHGAGAEALRPRGGSAYLCELDGNLTVWNDGAGNITLHANRLRGAMFDPILFALQPYTLVGYAQPDGDPVGSIVAMPLTDTQAEAQADAERRIEDRLMEHMRLDPSGSEKRWADAIGVTKSRAHRILVNLEAEKFVKRQRGKWVLTRKAKNED